MSSEARVLTLKNASHLAEWCRGRLVNEQDAISPHVNQPGINVPTKDGVARASLGDSILKHSDGTFEVVKHPAEES